MKEVFRIAGEEFALFVSRVGDGLRVHLPDGGVADACEGITVARAGDRLYIQAGGAAHEVIYVPAISRHAGEASASQSDDLLAPMPGAVVACAVAPGDAVAAGDLLLVIESMKLETSLKAWRAGRVDKVHVAVGQSFERDRVLLSLEPAP